jgi:hypothetical protein
MKLGTDPEFFIRNKHGKAVPAHVLFENKALPSVVAPGVTAFRDGYAVELNVPPCDSEYELIEYVRAGLRGVQAMLPPGWHLSTAPAVKIDLEKDLAQAPEDVLHFGCEPSYCAYDDRAKLPKINATKHPYRYAGAHLHFSTTLDESPWMRRREDHRLFIRMLDLFVGAPLTLILKDKLQFLRRGVYGQAGEYRPQEYPDGSIGLEYRTPSPGLFNNVELAANAIRAGAEIFRQFQTLKAQWIPALEAQTRLAVNQGAELTALIPPAPWPKTLIKTMASTRSNKLFTLI